MGLEIPNVFSEENNYSIAQSLKYKVTHRKSFFAFMLAVLLSAFFLRKSDILPRFMLKPPKNWLQRYKNNLKKIIGDDEITSSEAAEKLTQKTVRINFGGKNGCIRRWLLLNSNDPYATLAYSNYKNIAPVKAKNDGLSLSLKDRLNFDDLCANVSNQNTGDKFIVGIFHPFCNSGGGGERVLWELCKTILDKYEHNKNFKIAIYTGDVDIKPEDIIEKVKFKFGIDLDIKKICFIYLEGRHRVEGKTWPIFTLLFQAISSIFLLKNAISKLPPDCLIDTMGYPFIYPFMKFLYDIPVLSYTHYPIIQREMLSMKGLHIIKKLYWLVLYVWYKFCGYSVDYSIVNSTWTKNHMDSIWTMIDNNIVYPPCLKAEDTKPLPKDHKKKWQCVLVAQYRPEKRHELAITQFKKYLDSLDGGDQHKSLGMIFVGSIRSLGDEVFLRQLKYKAYKVLKIPEDKLVFKTNLSYADLLTEIKDSQFGLNTMWNEHFGISVVEYFSNNTIPLAHASAGPLLDILGPVLDTAPFENLKEKLFFIDESDPDYGKESAGKYSELYEVFNAVDKLGSNSDVWSKLGKAGFDYVLNKFSNETFDEAFNEKILDSLVNDILKCKAKRGESDVECQ